jgi:hypothetical protein
VVLGRLESVAATLPSRTVSYRPQSLPLVFRDFNRAEPRRPNVLAQSFAERCPRRLEAIFPRPFDEDFFERIDVALVEPRNLPFICVSQKLACISEV